MVDKQTLKNFIVTTEVIETNKITNTMQLLAKSEEDALSIINDRNQYVDTVDTKKVLLTLDKTRTIKQAE